MALKKTAKKATRKSVKQAAKKSVREAAKKAVKKVAKKFAVTKERVVATIAKVGNLRVDVYAALESFKARSKAADSTSSSWTTGWSSWSGITVSGATSAERCGVPRGDRPGASASRAA